MDKPLNIAHLDDFVSPFTGKPVNRTRCGLCGAALPLPGDYPMMVNSVDPKAKLWDCTGHPGSTDGEGKPNLVQNGLTVLKPMCWAHVQ